MLCPMKGMLFYLTILLLFSLGACSVAEQDANAVGQKFQDGLQGRGQVVPNNPTKDSFGPEYQ